MSTTAQQNRPACRPLSEADAPPAARLTEPPVAGATDALEAPVRMPLASLLSGHVLHDGEIVQIIIKPSRWFIVLHSLLFSAGVFIVIGGLNLLHWQPLVSGAASVQLMILLIAARLMWAVLQWMGRYYILTNLRLIRLSGVFDVEIGSIPLRKVSHLKLYRTVAEGLLRKGSIEIIASDLPVMLWQTISRPKRILEHVTVAVKKAQQNGQGGVG